MRFLIYPTGKTKEVVALMDTKEATELHNILIDYCDKNKRKTNAKKLLKDFDSKLEIY